MKSKKILKLILLTLVLVFLFGIYTFLIANISRETPLEKYSSPKSINIMQPDDNYEENDDYYYAYDLSYDEDTWLSYINGLGIQADDDWYEIYINMGYERLLVTLLFTDSEGDIDITVYDSSLTYIDGSYSTSDNEYIDVAVPSDGTYFLYIYGANAGNEYDLWWDDVLADDNYEENDYYYDAYDLSSYDNVWLSSIDGSGLQYDDDWYEIIIISGYEHLIVDLTFSLSAGDLNLAVYNNMGSLVISSTTSTDNENIDTILPSNGTYYIKVYGDVSGNSYDLKWDGQPRPIPGYNFYILVGIISIISIISIIKILKKINTS